MVFIFDGETYKRAECEELLAEILYLILTEPRLEGLHDADGRLWPLYWLLVDVLNARAFVLRAEVVRETVIEQRPIGWVPPEDLFFPLKDDGSEAVWDFPVSR